MSISLTKILGLLDQRFLTDLGIADWSFTNETKISEKSERHFTSWLNQKKNNPLDYLEGERALKRLDLKNYYPSCQSALVFLFPYKNAQNTLKKVYDLTSWNKLKMSSYLFFSENDDYHLVISQKLNAVVDKLKSSGLDFNFKMVIDTAPVLERDLAYRSGLGWFGKNSLLINRRLGSFFFIATVLLDQPIEGAHKKTELDHCGQCLACVESCPTNAIDEIERTLQASLCISSYTIEFIKKDQLSMDAPDNMVNAEGEIFGCDICQDVCPWNIKESQFEWPKVEIDPQGILAQFFLLRPIEQVIKELGEMSNNAFRKLFVNTPVSRSGRQRLLKNILFWQKNL